MNKVWTLVSMLVLFSLGSTRAQVENDSTKVQVIDSIQQEMSDDSVIIDVAEVEKRPINPLAPSKAAFYSAVMPGLGQIYNKRYWKVPIVYAALGLSTYSYLYNDDYYKRFRTAFKRRNAGFTDDEFYDINGDNSPTQAADLDIGDLQTQQERFQKSRDLMLVVTIGLYALNIVDANVDAHLKQFNVDENLTMDLDIKPYLDYNSFGQYTHYGLAMRVTF